MVDQGGTAMKAPKHYQSILAESGHFLPSPFAEILGPYEGRDLSTEFDLSRFGAHIETLFPGSQSALRHWHSDSDELVFILEGELTLVCDDGEFTLAKGDCAGFKAGEENGHHLVNRSASAASFLVIGSRSKEDRVHYPDDDLMWLVDEDGWKPARKDGAPLGEGR